MGGRLAGGTMPAGRRRPGLAARRRPLRVGRAWSAPSRSCTRSAATTSADDPGRALLRLGDPRARRARARAARRRRRTHMAAPRSTPTSSGSGCRGRSPSAAAPRSCWRAATRTGRAKAAASRWRRATPSARGCQRRFSRGTARPGARRRGRARRRDRRAARGRERARRCGSVRVRDETPPRAAQARRARGDARARPRPATPGVGSLTKRELEIAGLVTDRKTNREIAAALFLSDKTVESHLRNIFVKLGVSSRVEVARTVERDRAARRSRVSAGAGRRPTRTPRVSPSSATRRSCTRRLRIFDNVALGFAAISPVVGLYAVVLVGTVVAGPAWVWVLPVALAGQCLLLAVYSELASEFPIAGGAYQWSRRLIGGAYGWFTGWVAICAYAVANTTIAYLGAPWALTLLGIEATPEPDRRRRDGAGARLRGRGRVRHRRARARGEARASRRRRRLGRDRRSRCCSSSASRTSACSPTRSAPRRCRADRSSPRCSPRSPSAAGSSSASTPASAPRRRPRTPRATCRARSGSRC